MMLTGIRTDRLASGELAGLVKKVRLFTNGGYDLYDKNEAAILRLLDKILVLAKKEKEWYLYFDALYCILYQLNRGDNFKAILKYAEIFFRDSALHMERELPNYPGTDMGETNSYCYANIFAAYSGFYQINDEKMETFMGMYKETVLKYGGAVHYYNKEMCLAVLYRDRDRLKRAKNNFEKYEVENCYVCMHLPYFAYYLLNDDVEAAEEFLKQILTRQIPKKHQWCYNMCQNTEAQSLYLNIMYDCLIIGKPDYFFYFYKKYWLGKFGRQEEKYGREFLTLSIFCCAIAGDFSELEADLREAENIMEKSAAMTTDLCIHKYLSWWGYFCLLEKSGVQEVVLKLPCTEQTGKVLCRDAADWFEKEADRLGGLFEKAREKYDYRSIKDSYGRCVDHSEILRG